MKNLLLLHGAIGSKTQLQPLAKLLTNSFRIYLLDFSGHGGEPVTDEPFSIKKFADDVLFFVNKNKIEGTNVFGYSMGGYVALYAARHFPGKLGKIFTTATKFEWNEDTSAKESRMLNPEKIREKIPKFAEELSKRHSPQNWETVLNKTAEMMINLGKNNLLKDEDLSSIENEVLVSVGDRDNMVSIDETVSAYRNLKKGKLLILPATPHPIEKISLERLSFELKLFFESTGSDLKGSDLEIKVNEYTGLELLNDHHAKDLFKLTDKNRKYLREWLPWVDSTTTIHDTHEFIKDSKESFAEENGFQCIIKYKNEIAGIIGLHYINHFSKKTELGYWLGADFQGNGIMTNACRFLIEYCFTNLKLNRIEIQCGAENYPSQGIPKRLNFTEEGILKQAGFLNGKFVDHILFAMLKDEWSHMKKMIN